MTEVRVELTESRGSRPRRFACLRTWPCYWNPVCLKWRVQESHLAVEAYEAPMSTRPPAMMIVHKVAGPGIEPGGPAL